MCEMSKPTTIKDAIKKWEEAHPGENIADATEVGFQFQWPPIEKMDNSLATLTNCRYKWHINPNTWTPDLVDTKLQEA